MTREELQKQIIESTAKNYIFCLATGVGKTALCLKKIASLYPKKLPKILVVVPYNVLKGSKEDKSGWTWEFYKWKLGKYLKNTTFTTYASLHKYVGEWDCLVCDEGHHTTDRCKELLLKFKIDHLFVLSATLKREHNWFFNTNYHPQLFNVDIHEAIDEGVLPEPRIVLVPIKLDNVKQQVFEFKSPSKEKCLRPDIIVDFKNRFSYLRYQGKVSVRCTQRQYSVDLDTTIDRAVQRGDGKTAKLVGGRRVKWLASQKTKYVKELIESLDEYRTLTFCGSIDNAEALGYPRIDSNIGDINLTRFNNGEFNHLSCIEKLDEGSNLNNCKIGIFQIINTSTRMSIQRAGRIYRHTKPILIFPYFEDSNDVKALNKFLEGYNTDWIYKVTNKEELIKVIKG